MGSAAAVHLTLVVAFLAVAALGACRSTSPGAGDRLRAELVVSEDARELWRGAASYGVRSAREGRAERVVSLPGLGELQAGLAADAPCRLVWSRDGLGSLLLYQGVDCGVSEGGRLCFDGARFSRAAADERAPRTVVIDGCADENDLLWSKLEGAQPATVGPTSLRQRCRRLPMSKGCALTYVKKQAIAVAHNDSGADGFALSFDGEGWRACFLESESGRYRIALLLEDSCGGRSEPVLEGDSAELDD